MECNCCFNDFIAKCEETLEVNVFLTPATNYRWIITDKFDHKYEGDVTSDADGHLSIPVTDLPAGLLTQYAGDFKLEILEEESCTPIKFKIAGEYDCISFSVKGGNFVKDYLGCTID